MDLNALGELSAEALIGWAIEHFERRATLSVGMGPGGLCLLQMIQDSPIVPYTVDTGFLFPETEALIDHHVAHSRLQVVTPDQSPDGQAEREGPNLWTRDPDLCCRLRKVEPNDAWLANFDCWITALRRDQGPSRAQTPRAEWTTLRSGHTVLKLNPIAAWTKKDVWRYVHRHSLKYNPLHDRGYPSIGCTHCTEPTWTDDERAGRWSDQSKVECGLHTGDISPATAPVPQS